MCSPSLWCSLRSDLRPEYARRIRAASELARSARGRLTIGTNEQNFTEVVNILLHEIQEGVLYALHHAYVPEGYAFLGSDSRLFHFDHRQFTEICACTAETFNECFRFVWQQWNKFRKKNCA